MGVGGVAVVGLLFPGQGSQHVGMGQALAAAYPEARRTFEEADDTLGFDLSRIAWEGPEDELTATSVAQPALLTHSIAALRDVEGRLETVAMAAGHSLGEFSAYVAAGMLSFADGLRTVRLRGELMQQGGAERKGTMAALIGLDDETVEALCREASTQDSVCVPANFNSAGQVVVSGDVAAVERAVELARAAGCRRPMILNVSGAFHSPLMRYAEPGLRQHMNALSLAAPAFPVVSNVTAEPVTDPDSARDLLVAQLTSSVRWAASMQTMVDTGIRSFLELGPGQVLTKLLRRMELGAECSAIGTPADVEQVLA
jgi:[acyl-carrier-protein] S-malonyltransferase